MKHTEKSVTPHVKGKSPFSAPRKLDLKPREKLRKRVQRFLSNKMVVTIVGILLGGSVFLLTNWCVQFFISLLAESLMGSVNFADTSWWPGPFVFRGTWQFIVFYTVLGAVSVFVGAKVAYRMVIAYEPLEDTGIKGTNRFAEPDEIVAQYPSPINDKAAPIVNREKVGERTISFEGDIEGKPGFPISRYGNKLYVDRTAANMVIFGTTRSGKGELEVLPTIDIFSRPNKLENKASLVISDPKGELCGQTAERLEARGYVVKVLNLVPPFRGAGFNPLSNIRISYHRALEMEAKASKIVGSEKEDLELKLSLEAEAEALKGMAISDARSIAFSIYNDPKAHDKVWQRWSISMVTATILAVLSECYDRGWKLEQEGQVEEAQKWYDKVTLPSVINFISENIQPNPLTKKSPLDMYLMQSPWQIRVQYAPINSLDSESKGNVYGDGLAALTVFIAPPIAKLLSVDDIHFEDIGFGDQPVALFLVTPDYDPTYDDIITMLLNQLTLSLARRADKEGGHCRREVVFMLDEFGNIPAIPNMDRLLQVTLGRGFRFSLVVQGKPLLEYRYGADVAKNIIENCANKMYILSSDRETADWFSKELSNGQVTVESRYGSSPLDLDKHYNESADARPLLFPDELMRLGPGECVLLRTMYREMFDSTKSSLQTRQNPIFNTGVNRMVFAHEYMGDTFQKGKGYLEYVNQRPCSHLFINREDRMFTMPDAFMQKLEESYAKKEQPQKPEDMAKEKLLQAATAPVVTDWPLFAYLTDDARRALLDRIENIGLLKNGETDIVTGMTADEFDEWLQNCFEQGKIKEENYDALYTIVEKGYRPEGVLSH